MIFGAAGAALVMAGCASSPDKMTAADVSPLTYQAYDCQQLAAEGDRIQRKVNTLYDQLKKKADADSWQMGIGLVLFWPALFFLEGGDGPEATEYRQLKGEYEAIRKTSIQRKCGLEFIDLDAELKERAAADKAKANVRKNPRD